MHEKSQEKIQKKAETVVDAEDAGHGMNAGMSAEDFVVAVDDAADVVVAVVVVVTAVEMVVEVVLAVAAAG